MASKTLDPIDILLELGIDLDDLSEQDYLGALMEAIATIEFKTKGKGDERSAALREEVIKIRKGKRKPQAKKTKISAGSLKSAPKLTGKTTKVKSQKLLPGTAGSQVAEETGPEQESIIKILTDISESVKSILYSLKASNNISKKLSEDERKSGERKKRTGAENKLEKKRFEGLKNLGSKLIQPVKGPLEMLFNFIKTILLGKVLMGILDWLGDPENQKKLQSLLRFFKDWWPTMVTAILLFGTGLGGLLKSIVGIAFKFVPKLLGLLPGLLRFLKSPMGRLASVAAGALGVAGIMSDGGEDDVDLTKKDPEPKQMMNGGMVPGGGPNKDTVPAMLAPGEFVMSRGAVQKYGSGMLGSMNAAGGGTNLPQRMDGITYAAGGGEVGDYEHREKTSSRHKQLMNERTSEYQAPGGVDKRHNQLMQSTSQEKIATYDKKHGEGAYSKKLREKLKKIYSSPSPSGTVAPKMMPKPTGKAVGRENLPPAMQYSKDGKKISADQFNKVQGMLGAAKEGGAKGVLNHMLSGAKSMFGGMFDKAQGAINDPKSFVKSMGGTVVDSNSQEQNMKRVMALPPEMREAVLADMKRSGGEVKESSGQNVKGATADRQLIKAQPGEYMLPADTVNNLGGPGKLDRLVAQTDSNSTPAKIGMRSKETPQVGPPMPMQPLINLIPTPSSGSKGSSDSSGSDLPNFDAGFGDPNKSKILGVVR
tara:strand:+ start:1765 stop:3885 length:2121 start_codon:yes stop_codon:yes gene_type:complete